MDEKTLKRGRILYIFEASFEYFISILVASTFLATLTDYLHFDTATTGIVSSFISLGCVFQLATLFIFKGRAKKKVIAFSIINQLLFTLLFVIPLLNNDEASKRGIFIMVILLAYLIYNIAHPAKINWLMSLVEDKKRGKFTATKEIVSLISGVGFTFAMGAVIDYYDARCYEYVDSITGKTITNNQEMEKAFIIIAVCMVAITIFHTLCMIFTAEKEAKATSKKSTKEVFSVLKDKNVIKVAIAFSLWYITSYSTTPFYGAYQKASVEKDLGLGFPMWFISILATVYAFARAGFSYFWGYYADKYSFANMIRICFGIAGISFLVNIFCTPANGWVVFTIHYVIYAISMAGINSALINLCYDFVGEEKRRDALAICLAMAGLLGFLTSTLMAPLVSYIENNNNHLFGINVYATQVTSLIACVMSLVCILYVSIFMTCKRNKKQLKSDDTCE